MDKYSLTSCLFLLTIYSIGVTTLVQNIELFQKQDAEVIETMNEIYDNHLAFSGDFIDLWSYMQIDNSVSKITLLDDVEYGSLIKDDKGNLYFPANKVDVSDCVMRTTLFANSLNHKNIKYIYVQAPNKMVKGYTDKGVYSYNYSNQNADEFLKGLKANKVDYLDLREQIKKNDIDKEELFYKTDHHWTTPTAFWAYQKLIEMMQEKYQFNIDTEHYYTNLENYQVTKSENTFLGSLGRRVGSAVAGMDSYTYIEPNFETDYSVYNGVQSLMLPIKKGSFATAIVSQKILNSKDVNENKHAVYYEMDYRILKDGK